MKPGRVKIPGMQLQLERESVDGEKKRDVRLQREMHYFYLP